MTKVTAGITISLDGYITGPNDRPGRGLGDGGERLHYWVFGGPWTYQSERSPGPTGVGKQFFEAWTANVGAVIGGRTTYWAAEAWGGQNPFGGPFFIVTHHPEDQPPVGGFRFVGSLEEALEQARAAAGERDVTIMGGADGQNMISCSHYVPDVVALRAASTRLVLGIGAESTKVITGRATVALSERLGTTPVTFPGGHAGFVPAEWGQGGVPDAFAARLREVLTTET